MRERVTHKNNLNTTKLLQQSFNTLFTKYMTHFTSLVVFRGSVASFLNTGTTKFKLWSLLFNTGFRFLIAYREPTLNYVKAFFTFSP